LYIQQNPDIYPKDTNKIQFTLGFFTEGLPAEWALLFIEKVAKKDQQKQPEPWGTWNEFHDELNIVFRDLNEEQNELTKLENLMMKTGQTAMEFFQEFDLYALRADYMKNDKVLIRMAEKKIPRQLVRSLYNRGKPSPVYQTWKQHIIDADNIEREFRDATSHNTTTAAPSNKDINKICSKTRSKSKSKSQDTKKKFFFNHPKPAQTNTQQTGPLQQKPEGKCFLCRKEGHWKKDCSKLKGLAQLRTQILELNDTELDVLNGSSSF